MPKINKKCKHNWIAIGKPHYSDNNASLHKCSGTGLCIQNKCPRLVSVMCQKCAEVKEVFLKEI